MNDKIFQAAADGALILTVNDRLSRHLQQEYDASQQRLGAEVWLRPQILSFSAWLVHCQKKFLGTLNVLNNTQLQNVWESIIEQDMQSSGVELLHIPQTAKRARQAYQLLVSYNADFGATESAADHQAFLRWRKKWQELSRQKGWHDPVSLPWLLAGHFMDHKVATPHRFVFAGFDEITPDIHNLINVLEGKGYLVEHWHPTSYADVDQKIFEAVDPGNEISHCARWACSILQHNPSARIGVVTPQLEVCQSLLERTFAAELEPAAVMAGDEESRSFNISLGKGLDAEEVVSSALRLLRFERQIEQTELSWLLHTPYLSGGISEAPIRAKLDYELLNKRIKVWPFKKLLGHIEWLKTKRSLTASKFSKILEFISSGFPSNKRQPPGVWAEQFILLLRNLGWPGERGLSSREYQALGSFNELFAELASLDSVSKALSRSEALQILARLASQKSFQPEGMHASVQILGVLESAGFQFDHLWVLGLHDRALPSMPSPNPFIPLPVQRRYQMKRADAEREYRFAEQVVNRLFSSAPQVILSWSAQQDGAPLRKSPFVPEHLPHYQENPPSQSPKALVSQANAALEVLVDDRGPSLPPRRTFSGGTGILKDQALCPFRAFAHYRLRAEEADSADIGIDNMSRGTLVHAALEFFWEETKDQANLLSLSGSELVDRVSKAVTGALDRFERENSYDLPAKQRTIEALRLRKLVDAWLAIEKERKSFTVQAAEKRQQIAIGDLVIKTQIDRIDKLDDGKSAIIDYKTGLPDPAQWLDVRMTEPQLPVYCLSMPREEVGAVMFGVVRGKGKERGFKGLARDVEAWPGAISRTLERLLEEQGWEDFDQILEHWQTTLSGLGNSFAMGDACIDPVDPEKACKFCDLNRFCRISEKDADWQEGGQ